MSPLRHTNHGSFLIGILPLANATGDYGAYNTAAFNPTETWLRGGWYTDADGVVEMTTIYPGYYTGRAPHIHVMVHKDWSESNGFVRIRCSTSPELDQPNLGFSTLVSQAGTVLHIGQAFFPEDWNDQVYKTPPYPSNTQQRTLNSQDTILSQAFRNGYNAYTKYV